MASARFQSLATHLDKKRDQRRALLPLTSAMTKKGGFMRTIAGRTEGSNHPNGSSLSAQIECYR
jgi:hypothetical protein